MRVSDLPAKFAVSAHITRAPDKSSNGLKAVRIRDIAVSIAPTGGADPVMRRSGNSHIPTWGNTRTILTVEGVGGTGLGLPAQLA